jgi:hypothetical protein
MTMGWFRRKPTPAAAEPPPDRLGLPEAAATLRPGATGTPVEALGQTWLLADHVPDFDDVWDRLYDDGVISGQNDLDDLRCAGWRLLKACHALPDDLLLLIVAGIEPHALAAAVGTAISGPDEPRRTWSSWARGSLVAAGLNPADVPPGDRRPGLDLLTMTGRTVPVEQWVSSVQTARERSEADLIRANLAARAAGQAAAQKPAGDPPPRRAAAPEW